MVLPQAVMVSEAAMVLPGADAILPDGFAIPPLPYLVVLAAGAMIVGGLLWQERPAVTEGLIVALAPWMVVGASLHVLFQIDAVPSSVAPLLGTPAVYVSTAIVAGAVWFLARRLSDSANRVGPVRILGGVGGTLLVVAVLVTLSVGGVARPVVPLAALVVGVLLGVVAWMTLARFRPDDVAASGDVGLLVLLGHALDGVSTAAGVDVLGFGERSPASRAILDLAASLPTAELLGAGWLFVLVKVIVAAAVVVLFAEYVREEPTPGYALLGLVAALGLGPGAHNLLLFAVATG